MCDIYLTDQMRKKGFFKTKLCTVSQLYCNAILVNTTVDKFVAKVLFLPQSLFFFYRLIFITSNHGLQNIPPWHPNSTNRTQNINIFPITFLCYTLSVSKYSSAILVRAHTTLTVSVLLFWAAGSFIALLKKHDVKSSDLIGQILLWCHVQPVT